MFRQLDEHIFVAGQIRPDQLGEVKAQGIALIVNNRPDDEEAGQPPHSEMEAAASAAGLEYRYIPVGSGFSANQVQAMSAALEEAQGPVLAFCRSGTRSTFLWALARAQQGTDGQELISKAASAGYDLSPIRAFLQR